MTKFEQKLYFFLFLNFFIKTSCSSPVVKYLPHHLKVEGSNPAAAAGTGEREEKRKKEMKKEIFDQI